MISRRYVFLDGGHGAWAEPVRGIIRQVERVLEGMKSYRVTPSHSDVSQVLSAGLARQRRELDYQGPGRLRGVLCTVGSPSSIIKT